MELPDGKGFDVIRRIGPDRMPAVVFVTAYDKYAIQAFEVNAVDYLLKPFDQSRLLASLDRVQRPAGRFGRGAGATAGSADSARETPLAANARGTPR